MALTITSALAVGFDYAGETLTVGLSSGTTYTATLAAVTSGRVLLADSTHDLLQVLQTALNAMPSLPGGTTFAVSISATTGLVTIACTGDTFKITALGSSVIGPVLGFGNISLLTASSTATYQPRYLCFFASRESGGWSPRTPMAAAETAGGVSYGTTSATTRWEDAFAFGFIPSDTTQVAALSAVVTPWEPAAASLGSLGSHTGAWGVSDSLAVALGKTCALARGNYVSMCSSTSERYDLVAISGADLAAPRVAYQFGPVWSAYKRWTVSLIRQTTPTGTRA